MRDVYMIGAYTTVFKKHPGLSFADLAREAYLGTLADAGMAKGTDIETGWLGNCGMGFWGQNSIRGQALFQPLVAAGLLFGLSPAEALALGFVLRLRDLLMAAGLLLWPWLEWRKRRS